MGICTRSRLGGTKETCRHNAEDHCAGVMLCALHTLTLLYRFCNKIKMLCNNMWKRLRLTSLCNLAVQCRHRFPHIRYIYSFRGVLVQHITVQRTYARTHYNTQTFREMHTRVARLNFDEPNHHAHAHFPPNWSNQFPADRQADQSSNCATAPIQRN